MTFVDLEYQEPFDWSALLTFLRARAIAGVEVVDGDHYRRNVRLGSKRGHIVVRKVEQRASLRVTLSPSLSAVEGVVAARVRALFDLDADPRPIRAVLKRHPATRAGVRQRPGLRVPGTFDAAELAVRTVLGQQVSVAAATTLCRRFVQRLGTPLRRPPEPELTHLFPSAKSIAGCGISDIQSVGLPQRRAQTIVDLCGVLAQKPRLLTRGADPETAMRELLAVSGIGPWTAHYLAMCGLGWGDAFPGGDLAVRKALNVSSTRQAEELVEPLRPWRAYAVMHLWHALSSGG